MKTFKDFKLSLDEDGAVGIGGSGPTNVSGSPIAAGPNDIGMSTKNKKFILQPMIKRANPNGKISK